MRACCAGGFPPPPERLLSSDQEIAVPVNDNPGPRTLNMPLTFSPGMLLKTMGGGRGSKLTVTFSVDSLEREAAA
jgi:hypothetical protein